MALGDDLKNLDKDLRNLNRQGAEFQNAFKAIETALKGIARDSNDFGDAIKNAAQTSSQLAKQADALSKFNKENLKSTKDRKSFEEKSNKILAERTKLEAQIKTLKGLALNATKQEKALLDKATENLLNQVSYADDIQSSYKGILETNKKLERINPFKSASDFVKDIPIINKAFSELADATEAFNDEIVESGDRVKALGKSVSKLGGLAVKGTIGLIVKGIGDFDKKATSLTRTLNTTAQESEELAVSANDAAQSIAGITGQDIINSQLAFSEALGTTAALSNETAANFATLQNRLGLSVQQATEFTKLNEALGKNSKKQTEELIAQTLIQNTQNDSAIRYQDVIKDISETNKAVLLSSKGNATALSRAAIEARKFGLNLNEADSIAGSLLDFESSIASELEAELLTGKQLNLERARQAALEGDLATLTSEIASNVGSAEEFANMNRLQQEAIAKAVGMTRESLASSLVEQQALTKLGAKDKSELKEKTRLRLQEVNAIKDVAKREEARAKLIADLGSDELVRQQENRTNTELMAEAAQKIIEAFDYLSTKILPKIKPLLEGIANNAQFFATAIATIAGISLIGKFSKLLKLFKGLGSAASKLKGFFGGGGSKVTSAVMKGSGKKVYGAAAQSAVKAGSATAGKSLTKVAGKAGAKLGGKTLLKRIPILGSVVGLGFAVDRAMKGDFAGAALEVGSAGLGLLDLAVPGLGTGLSLAVDAGIAARDLKRAGTITPTATPMATGGMVTSPTNTIIGEAGPEAVIPLSEFYRKFDELIAAVKSSGNINLDGRSLNTSMKTSGVAFG
tara:strand:+ start:1174 stop:3582 length:2409 start_codon:yes stop_codon:yes gene_type:complete